jgi:ABC-type transporter Mla maintaining outer membrane lipid asymmetry ATPase subunit MlaF
MLPHREKYPAQLSGGQKKRVGLARATALDPDMLYYDEPSAGLDPVTSSAIDELIMDLSSKLSVTSVVVTHDMASAFRIADRMVMLDQGRVLRIGPRSDFEALRDADPETLMDAAGRPDRSARLIHQFVRGAAHGPITEGDMLAEYERILLGTASGTIPQASA